MEIFNYGQRIRDLREKDNISQRMLGDAIGVSRSAINQFERQYDLAPTERLNSIANYFDVSIDYLLGFTNKKQYKNSKKEIDFAISSIRLRTWRKSKKLTQEQLAKEIDVSPSIIVRHENNKHLLATPFLYQLCSHYKLSADYLLGKTDEPKNI